MISAKKLISRFNLRTSSLQSLAQMIAKQKIKNLFFIHTNLGIS
jgi:hypothetical protein